MASPRDQDSVDMAPTLCRARSPTSHPGLASVPLPYADPLAVARAQISVCVDEGLYSRSSTYAEICARGRRRANASGARASSARGREDVLERGKQEEGSDADEPRAPRHHAQRDDGDQPGGVPRLEGGTGDAGHGEHGGQEREGITPFLERRPAKRRRASKGAGTEPHPHHAIPVTIRTAETALWPRLARRFSRMCQVAAVLVSQAFR